MITAKSAGSAHKWSSENGNFGCKPDLMAQFKEKYASAGNFFYIFIPPYALYHSHIMITAKSAGSAHKWSSENGNFGYNYCIFWRGLGAPLDLKKISQKKIRRSLYIFIRNIKIKGFEML